MNFVYIETLETPTGCDVKNRSIFKSFYLFIFLTNILTVQTFLCLNPQRIYCYVVCLCKVFYIYCKAATL